MPISGLQEVLDCLPHAVLRVDGTLRVQWAEPAFETKTGLSLKAGERLIDLLEPGTHRDRLEEAILNARSFSGQAITSALQQVRLKVQPSAGSDSPGCWVIFEAPTPEEEIAFARALHEMTRAVGQTLEVDEVCAAAVAAMVQCAQVCRAEVYLRDGELLRRVATSDVAGSPVPDGGDSGRDFILKEALATGEVQLRVFEGASSVPAGIFAAIPLIAQRRKTGALLLFKEKGASFSGRELDLCSAAAGQLAVAVENARLLLAAQSALRIRDEFMSIASHELKTPLTPLKMALYTMERRLSNGLPIELASVVKSKRQVDRLAGLVNDLLDVSRLELGKLGLDRTPLELSLLVREVVEEFRLAYDRRYEVSLPKDRLWVMGERDRLEQVLVNLLENAQKYSPQQEPIRIQVERRRDQVRVKVVDRGIGIPASDQAQVFERFYRAHNAAYRNFGGLGLGLFLSRSILKLHGGELLLESEEGQGTTFTIVLPLMPWREVHKLPKRVLLLEEDPVQENAARLLLNAEGFEVLTAKSPAEALHKLSETPMDLLLVSCELAGRPEAGFVHAFQASPTGRPIPVLFAGPSVPSWAGSASRCDWPYSAAELGAAARRAVGMPLREMVREEPASAPAERLN